MNYKVMIKYIKKIVKTLLMFWWIPIWFSIFYKNVIVGFTLVGLVAVVICLLYLYIKLLEWADDV